MLDGCKGCLLREDVTQANMMAVIRDYLDTMPAERRVFGEVYEQRLNLCRTCPSLRQGTCSRCGCFVEIRAAKGLMHCPHVPPKW